MSDNNHQSLIGNLRRLADRLQEWRAGTHQVFDETGRETGEMVDEPKDFRTMQIEREEAAVALRSAADELETKAGRIGELESWVVKAEHFIECVEPDGPIEANFQAGLMHSSMFILHPEIEANARADEVAS